MQRAYFVKFKISDIDCKLFSFARSKVVNSFLHIRYTPSVRRTKSRPWDGVSEGRLLTAVQAFK